MKRLTLYFVAPGKVELREEPLPDPEPGQVAVRTFCSAISSGTEMLIYRGEAPENLAADSEIAALRGTLAYPLRYGYAAIGRVIALGAGVPSEWEGRVVLAFHPHASAFLADPAALQPLPVGISMKDAVFLPNMETATNFLMDGAPVLGEQIAVFGQGIVGLLTTALLAAFPLAMLVTLDRYEKRRAASLALGAHASLDPEQPDVLVQARMLLQGNRAISGADLVYELSGVPEALDQALAVAGFAGRVVVGSWYGCKPASLNLGGEFHRNRIRLLSSQVSTLAPELRGRWTKARRFAVAWEMLRRIRPAHLITHCFPIERAPEAYQLLAEQPETAIQVLLTFGEGAEA